MGLHGGFVMSGVITVVVIIFGLVVVEIILRRMFKD